MTKQQIDTFVEHAEEYGCIPVIVHAYRNHKYWIIFNGPESRKTLPITPVSVEEFKKWSVKQNKVKAARNIKSCNVALPVRKAFMNVKSFIKA